MAGKRCLSYIKINLYTRNIVVKAVVLAVERSLSELVSYTCLFVLPRPSSVFR